MNVSEDPNFNAMTPAQQERLVMLLEEAVEIAHIGSKILRHGYSSYNPHDYKRASNRSMLEKELGDLLGVLELLFAERELSENRVMVHAASRVEKIKNGHAYTHHQGN